MAALPMTIELPQYYFAIGGVRSRCRQIILMGFSAESIVMLGPNSPSRAGCCSDDFNSGEFLGVGHFRLMTVKDFSVD
jgi:hypothetical protein